MTYYTHLYKIKLVYPNTTKIEKRNIKLVYEQSWYGKIMYGKYKKIIVYLSILLGFSSIYTFYIHYFATAITVVVVAEGKDKTDDNYKIINFNQVDFDVYFSSFKYIPIK